MRNAYSVLKYPVATEKVVRLLEAENKLLFVIDMKANKQDVKRSVEEAFGVKVSDVNTFVSNRGVKKAYVKLMADYPAMDIMTRLGLM